MNRAPLRAVLALLLAGWLGQAVAQADGSAPLTLAGAVRLAEVRSQALVAADAQLQAARQRAFGAGELPDANLRLGITNLPINGSDRFSLSRDFMTMRSIGVMQELTAADKRRARVRRADREVELGLAERQVQLAELQRETALAWIDRSSFESIGELLARQLAEAELLVQAAEASYRAARGAQPEVFAARGAAAMLQDRMAENQRRIATATVQLVRWVGEAGEGPIAGRPPADVLPFGSETLDAHLAHHPMLQLAAGREAAAEAEVEVARLARGSDWSVEVMLSQRGSAYSDMASIQFSRPLQWNAGRRTDSELAARIALREQARAATEERLRTHLSEARSGIVEWRSLRERAAAYGRSLLPLARQQAESALAGYGGGSGSLASVLEARRMELDTRMEQLRLETESARAWARLVYLVPANVDMGTMHTTPSGGAPK